MKCDLTCVFFVLQRGWNGKGGTRFFLYLHFGRKTGRIFNRASTPIETTKRQKENHLKDISVDGPQNSSMTKINLNSLY